MKKTKSIISLLLIIFTLLSFSSCSVISDYLSGGDDNGKDVVYTVTFVLNNGEDDIVKEVPRGSKLDLHDSPQKDLCTFVGWYIDKELKYAMDFSNAITSSMTLYAKYIPDYAQINTEVQKNVVPSCIYIHHSVNVGPNAGNSFGSGVVFKKTGNTYYALTNCHVTGQKQKTPIFSIGETYSVSDCFGNSFSAELVCCDPDYDLAVVSFVISDSSKAITPVEFADKNPGEDTAVIAVGGPLKQCNCVTYGNVFKYESIALDGNSKNSNVEFPILWHSAYIAQGSSGGGLFNLDYKLVAINYAAGVYDEGEKEGEFSEAYAIPIEKVKEFLTNNGL